MAHFCNNVVVWYVLIDGWFKVIVILIHLKHEKVIRTCKVDFARAVAIWLLQYGYCTLHARCQQYSGVWDMIMKVLTFVIVFAVLPL